MAATSRSAARAGAHHDDRRRRVLVEYAKAIHADA
jgi:hypothetical protein